MTFEQVERGLRAKNPLAAELEDTLLSCARSGRGPQPAARSIRHQLAARTRAGRETLGDGLSPINLFFQSFVIMLREGLEAILIVGALMTFLVKMGASHRKRDINLVPGPPSGPV